MHHLYGCIGWKVFVLILASLAFRTLFYNFIDFSAEDDWLRLHDIRLNGPILEYIGRGKSLVDVGLAQAKTPICTRNHYFEIEVYNLQISM